VELDCRLLEDNKLKQLTTLWKNGLK